MPTNRQPPGYPAPESTPRHRWAWPALLVLVTLLALGMRLHYVVHAQVLQPVDDQQHVRADGVEYYAYARNLVRHGVFSMAPENRRTPPPDSFRDPGYPVFLAAWMKVCHDWDAWYAAVLLSQAVLGALTVPLALLLARPWMPLPWLGAAGLALAVWPHSIAIDSFILSEAWVGFLAIAGLALLGVGLDRDRCGWAIGGSLVLALAALSNAVLVPALPVAVAWLLARRRIAWRTALCVLVVPLLLIAGWQVRNATLPDGPSSSARALINLDQGSWPDYHAAYQGAARHDPGAERALQAIDRETAWLQRDPPRGLRAMAVRMGAHPLRYLAWYASKPALLWGWDIRMGQGDIYVYPTRASPFVEQPAWRALAALCRALNPLLMVAMGVAWIVLASGRRWPASLQLAGAFSVYVTAIYTLLQAEPRYAIPFRPLEILLAFWVASLAAKALSHARRGRAQPLAAKVP